MALPARPCSLSPRLVPAQLAETGWPPGSLFWPAGRPAGRRSGCWDQDGLPSSGRPRASCQICRGFRGSDRRFPKRTTFHVKRSAMLSLVSVVVAPSAALRPAAGGAPAGERAAAPSRLAGENGPRRRWEGPIGGALGRATSLSASRHSSASPGATPRGALPPPPQATKPAVLRPQVTCQSKNVRKRAKQGGSRGRKRTMPHARWQGSPGEGSPDRAGPAPPQLAIAAGSDSGPA
jgi:hypothetical protein